MKQKLKYLLPIALILLAIAMIAGTAGMYSSPSTSAVPAVGLADFTYETACGRSGTATFPHSFRNLEPMTEVTIRTYVNPGQYYSILVKTVYTSLRLFADDILIYEVGQEGSFPAWLLDPPTILEIIYLPQDASYLRFEYISPSQRTTMSVPAVLVGTDGSLLVAVFMENSIVLTVSVLFIFMGLAVIAIAIINQRKGGGFIFLGLFSLLVGLWGFAESDATQFMIPYPAVLYMIALGSLFMLGSPLLRYGLFIMKPKNPYPLRITATVVEVSALTAYALQLMGIASLSRTLFIFQALATVAFIVFSATTIWEHFRHRNMTAKLFIMPLLVLTGFIVLEYINFFLRFTHLLSTFVLFGFLIFILCMGIIGMYRITKEAEEAKKEKQKAKESEQHLAIENAALESLSRMKSEYLANISHETKTPLAIISVNVQMAADLFETANSTYAELLTHADEGTTRQLTEDSKIITEALERAQEAVLRVGRMADNNLWLASNQENREKMSVIEISKLLVSSTEIRRRVIEKEGNKLILNIPDDFNVQIYGNAGSLSQVIDNLLANARNHTASGEISVRAECEGDFVVVSVSDTGVGIDPSILPRIFERGITSSGGTGIGLAICKSIIESHGGEIWLESEQGKGTTATFKVPIFNESEQANA